MIEFNYVPDQASIFTYFPGLTWPIGSPSPAPNLSIPQLLVASTQTHAVLASTSEDIPFGYFQQGKQDYGSLHDHDVRHLKGSGWVMANAMLRQTRPLSTLRTPYQLGWQANIGTSNNVPFIACIHIGQKYEFSTCIQVPPVKGTSRGNVYYDPITVSSRVVWDIKGRTFYWEVYRSPFKIYTQGTDAVLEDVPERWGCCFGSLASDTTVANRSVWYNASIVSGVSIYSFGNGKTGVAGRLQPVPKIYAVNMSTVATVNTTHTVGSGSIPIQASEFMTYVNKGYFESSLVNMVIAPSQSYDYGELGGDIIESQKYVDANLLLTVFDLFRLAGDISAWTTVSKNFSKLFKQAARKGFRTPASIQKWLRTLARTSADAYLGLLYGVLPNLRDGQQAMKMVELLAEVPIEPSRRHARRTSYAATPQGISMVSTHTLTAEIENLPSGLGGNVMGMVREAKKAGLWPNFEALWDFVPYSFVFDWISRLVSDRVKYADTVVDSLYFPINYCIVSTKTRLSLRFASWLPPQWGLTGSVEVSYYDRYVMRSLPLPPIQGGGESPQFSHWGEALALIVQRKH